MRRPRLHVPGGFYHVTLRGNHRQDIFFSDEDRFRLERYVATALEQVGARTHAYCWMTNHIHLLIQVADTPLGAFMQRIGTRYARAVQARVLASVVGEEGLAATDRQYLAFGVAFEGELVNQAAPRSLEQSMDIGWRLLAGLPLSELSRLSDAQIAAHLQVS